MFVSLDFGGSTLDVVFWGEDGNLKKFFSVENVDVSLDEFALSWKEVEKVVVTGGKSRNFLGEFRGKKIVKVDEIESIGKGGGFLFGGEQTEKILVVSMGTGTCMVEVDGGVCRHIGGTGVGGGTFLGLTKELLGETDLVKLKKMFSHGKASMVDLSVEDIVGGDIGIISGDATASNLGKLVREIDFSKSDLASGIVNLIGQSIGTTVVFAAQACGCDRVVLTGKLTRIEQIVEVIMRVGGFYGVEMVVPEKAAYVSAIGAGVVGFASEWGL